MLLIILYTHTYEWNPTLFHFFFFSYFSMRSRRKIAVAGGVRQKENAGAVTAASA